jgi:hypothetical protein
MEAVILAAGSAVGALTAVAMSKVNGNGKAIKNIPIHTMELQRRVLTEAMNRVYDYEREGRITGSEREQLLAKYRQELNMLDNRMYNHTFYNLNEVNAFKEGLVAAVDQRVAQINARLDDLASKLANQPVVHSKPVARAERKEEKHVEAKPVEQVESESIQSDASLDEIKKQIMQTLSRLEQAEVE